MGSDKGGGSYIQDMVAGGQQENFQKKKKTKIWGARRTAPGTTGGADHARKEKTEF